jgi:hypothetical protein
VKTYVEKAIALVLDLHQREHICQAKLELIEFLKLVESDDKVYLHHADQCCFDKRGKAIACLSSYKPSKHLLPVLIKEAGAVLATEIHCDKTIYVISDDVPTYPLSRLKVCNKVGRLLFFEVGLNLFKESFESHWSMDIKSIVQAIREDYRKEVTVEDSY